MAMAVVIVAEVTEVTEVTEVIIVTMTVTVTVNKVTVTLNPGALVIATVVTVTLLPQICRSFFKLNLQDRIASKILEHKICN